MARSPSHVAPEREIQSVDQAGATPRPLHVQFNSQNGSADSLSNPTLRRSFSLERRYLENLYRHVGSPKVQFCLWDGSHIGDTKSSTGIVIFRKPSGVRRLISNSLMGFCEGYMVGDIDMKGSLIGILLELDRGLTRAGLGNHQTHSWWWPWKGHHQRDPKKVVQQHYNLGNDFYQLWLDQQMVYTCGYYRERHMTLDEAQTAKLDYVSRKLRLQPGETVVDAGCGWGGLALHMAREYGVRVRAFNLSHEQITYARERARAEGLGQRVEFIEDDYRNITGTYDAFVSVGMLEHVGRENYRDFGRLIDRVLRNPGRGLIHCIGRNVGQPLDPWTVKYIFPGAYAPSLREMMDLFEQPQFSVMDVENLRMHYSRTCADWLTRFDYEIDTIRKMFDEPFVRMWRLYLAASSAAFLNGDLQLFQVVFARADNNSLPWTREDWYE